MQKWSEWTHKDSESKGKWGRTTHEVPVRVKPKSEPMTLKREPETWTKDTQNANQEREVKECSKLNLKIERNWGSDWNNDTMTCATVKEKANQQDSVKENEA